MFNSDVITRFITYFYHFQLIRNLYMYICISYRLHPVRSSNNILLALQSIKNISPKISNTDLSGTMIMVNSEDPDQKKQSGQGLHCLSFHLGFYETNMKIKDKTYRK